MEVLQTQRRFFASQHTKDYSFRKHALKRLQREIVNHEADIAEALYKDFKKPTFETYAAESQFVLADIKYTLRKLPYWMQRQKVGASLMNWPSTDWIYKEPYGNVLIIAPWNYPFQLAMAPLVGALAAGNTAIIKPSEHTPHTSAIISKIINVAFKSEHVAVIEGGVEVSQNLLAQKWDYIFFTGSTRVGQIVYESAAKNLTPVTLELGGKNPTIVDETASVKLAAKRIVWGKFLNAGQTCIAPDYILVHKKVKKALISALKDHIHKAYGESHNESNDIARIVNKKQYDHLKGLLNDQNIISGGHTNDKDNFISPTLVDEPKIDSPLMQAEIFGPILPIITYETEDDIDQYICSYGKPLATYIFSNRRRFQELIINKYSFGGGAINDTIIQITNHKLPFGGVGSSGIGSYHGKKSFDIFSHHKPIIKKANWFDAPLRYPPYNLPMSIVKKIKHLF